MRRMKKIGLCITGALTLAGTAWADSELSSMISPITHPTTFEDPRHSTELRPIYAHHKIQDGFVTGGGDVNIYALQARAKITDDFSLIATKDGFVDLNPKGVVPDDSGLANIALGGKYSFYRDDTSILTGGLRYEFPTGKEGVLQGKGNGLINPFMSAGATFCGLNLVAGSGLRIRTDEDDSNMWDLDLHADYKIGNFYPTVELGMVKSINSGNRLPIADEGQDFFNLGASGSAGKTILTASVGARYRITDDIDAGVAYQFPLDRGEGTKIIDWRLTADMIFRFRIG